MLHEIDTVEAPNFLHHVQPAPAPGSPRPHEGTVRVARIEIRSVAKVLLALGAVAVVASGTAAVLVAIGAETSGLSQHLSHFASRVLGMKGFSLSPALLAAVAAICASVLSVGGVLLAGILAFTYGRIADLTGGLAVDLDSGGRRRHRRLSRLGGSSGTRRSDGGVSQSHRHG